MACLSSYDYPQFGLIIVVASTAVELMKKHWTNYVGEHLIMFRIWRLKLHFANLSRLLSSKSLFLMLELSCFSMLVQFVVVTLHFVMRCY